MSKTKLYIGMDEIKGVKKTVVTYVDGRTETFTDKQLTYMITKGPQDLTKQRDLMLKNVVPEVVAVLEAHNIRKWDLETVYRVVAETLDNALNIAVGKAFGTYKDWTHPAYFQEDIRISDIRRLAG